MPTQLVGLRETPTLTCHRVLDFHHVSLAAPSPSFPRIPLWHAANGRSIFANAAESTEDACHDPATA